MTAHTAERMRDPSTQRLGWYCATCRQWWTRQPVSRCPGVPVYSWPWDAAHAAGLRTKTQWRELRRRVRKGVRASAVFATMREWYPLYPEEATEPMRATSDAQRAVLAAGRRTQRTCIGCGYEYESSALLNWHRVCYSCVATAKAAESEARDADARAEASTWAHHLFEVGDFVLLDTETTGLGACEIVALAVVAPDGAVLLDTLVRPSIPIPASATAIHGITDTDVADAPTWTQIHPRLMEVVAGRRVLAYNASFDWSALAHTCRVHGIAWPIDAARWLDLMEPFASWYGEWSDYHGDYRWQPLTGGDHSARGDCLAALTLLRLMATPPPIEEEEQA